jgi:drug/metabolite transporter (DMT)-like permease
MPVQNSSVATHRNLRTAVLWVLLGCVCFSAMWGVIRHASGALHPFVLVFWRNLIGLLLVAAMVLRNDVGWLRTSRPLAHVRRATSGVIGTFATFYAVAHTPLATAISISYASPLIATLAAVAFFGEKIRIRRIAAILVGFAGVLIVVRPGVTELTPGIMAAFCAVAATAFSIIAVKQLTKTEDQGSILFYSFALMLLPSLALAWNVWIWPQGLQQWLQVGAIGVLATVGQTTIVRAYALADTSALLPYDFVRFIFVVVIGIVWFDERLDLYTLLGGSIILASTLYLAHRERLAAHSQKPTSAPKDIS